MKIKTSHTPGPWIIRDRTGTIGNPALGIEGPGCEVIASVIYNDGFNTLQSNARLIASAPELLACLKEIVFYTEGIAGLDEQQTAAIDAARTAILKAEGGEGGR